MSEEFSRLEETLTEAARQGNMAHVIALLRDTGRLHHLWQVIAPAPGPRSPEIEIVQCWPLGDRELHTSRPDGYRLHRPLVVLTAGPPTLSGS
jgi:hypothetical protein